MRLLADMHISPRTVALLRSLGHEVIRVDEVLLPNATDEAIVVYALADKRVVLTQDLDLSAIVALSGKRAPSVIPLRLSTSRVDVVNTYLQQILPVVEHDVEEGALVTVTGQRIRLRTLPIQ